MFTLSSPAGRSFPCAQLSSRGRREMPLHAAESLGGPWYLQARGGRRMGLGDFSWCELEGSLPLPPLLSSSPSLQWSSLIRAGPFFPEVSVVPPTLARASPEISASAAMAGDRSCFPTPVPVFQLCGVRGHSHALPLLGGFCGRGFPSWVGAGAGPCRAWRTCGRVSWPRAQSSPRKPLLMARQD